MIDIFCIFNVRRTTKTFLRNLEEKQPLRIALEKQSTIVMRTCQKKILDFFSQAIKLENFQKFCIFVTVHCDLEDVSFSNS